MQRSPYRTPGTPGSFLNSPAGRIDSPFVNAIEYQAHVTDLENENFTLKLMLLGIEKRFRTLFKSHNISEELAKQMLDQENTIAKTSAEIGKNTDSAHVSVVMSPSLKQQLESALDENYKLQKELQERDSMLEHSNATENTSVLADEENEELRSKLENAGKTIDSLNKQVQDLLNENKALFNEIADLQQTLTECDDLIPKLQELQNENKALKSENGELLSNIDDLENQNQKLNQDIDNVLNDLSLNDIEEIVPKYQDLLIENDDLKQQINDLGNKHNDDSMYHLSQESTFVTPNKAQVTNEEIKKLKSENERLQQKIDDLTKKKTAMSTSPFSIGKSSNSSPQKEKNPEIEKLLKRIAELESKLKSIPPQDLKELEDQLTQLNEENNDQQQQILELQDDNENLMNEIDSLKKELELTKKLSSRTPSPDKNKLKQLEDDDVPVKGQNDRYLNPVKKENAELRIQIEEAQQINEDLKKQLQTEKEKSFSLSYRNISIDAMPQASLIDYYQQIKELKGQMAETRKTFCNFYDMISIIIKDITLGANICINGTIAACRQVAHGKLPRADRRTLTELQKKWQGTFGPFLERCIEEENEKSLFGISPMVVKDTESLSKVLEQMQLIINEIWELFGQGQVPDVTKFTQFGVRFETFIKSIIDTLHEQALQMKEQIENNQDKTEEEIEPEDYDQLSPEVVALLKKVKTEIRSYNQLLSDEFNEVM